MDAVRRLTILRHAYALHKREWTRPDLQRPLNDLGHRQAIALVALLGRRVTRIISSPAVRCIQTVTPMADAVAIEVELWPDLGPSGSGKHVSAFFADATFDGAVLCTHGELLEPLAARDDISRLARQRNIKRDVLLSKGSAWRLRIDPAGTVTKLTHLLPSTS
jgi:phosphohistidine phosphatase SixA